MGNATTVVVRSITAQFSEGEQISATSGSGAVATFVHSTTAPTATVLNVSGGAIEVCSVVGNFDQGETITGLPSGAIGTFDRSSIPVKAEVIKRQGSKTV